MVRNVFGEPKATKTGLARRVPIEPALFPLLQAMHKESGGTGRVLSTSATDRHLSRQLRLCLRLAGITRAELLEDETTHKRDATRKPRTFHDLRATGITWCAVRGDDPLKIKQRAGHTTFSTTERYIREAENLRDAFPPPPQSLLGEGCRPEFRPVGDICSVQVAAITNEPMVEALGIEFSKYDFCNAMY